MLFPFYNYRVSGLCPSSGIPNTIKHNVSETGCFRHVIGGGGGEDLYTAGSLINKKPKPVIVTALMYFSTNEPKRHRGSHVGEYY
jgi:hypothetical protein